MINLNIGCGKDKRQGYVNIDVSAEVNPDRVLNIEDGLPFEDNSVKEIIAFDILEQISSPQKLIFVLNELWRVTESNSRVLVRVPNASRGAAFQDPMDIRMFIPETFTYWQGTHYHYQNYGKSYGFKPWKVERIECKNENLMEFMMMPLK